MMRHGHAVRALTDFRAGIIKDDRALVSLGNLIMPSGSEHIKERGDRTRRKSRQEEKNINPGF